jgi:hypothetical protein
MVPIQVGAITKDLFKNKRMKLLVVMVHCHPYTSPQLLLQSMESLILSNGRCLLRRHDSVKSYLTGSLKINELSSNAF